jgi:hypothetical protein
MIFSSNNYSNDKRENPYSSAQKPTQTQSYKSLHAVYWNILLENNRNSGNIKRAVELSCREPTSAEMLFAPGWETL